MAVDNAFTVALLHMDGTDASTTFTDESSKTWTARGNAQIDTAQSVFGGASGLFDGTGDWIDTPDHADFDLGGGDFTIDFRVRFAAVGISEVFAGQDDAVTDRGWHFYFQGALTRLVFQWSTDGTNAFALVFSPWDPSVDTWYHVAITRSGTSLRVFVDGTQVGTTQTISTTIWNSSDLGRIGTLAGTFGFLNGWIDEFRLSKGIARWTANFTPQNYAYIATTVTWAQGAYTYTGQAIGLYYGRLVAWAQGAYTYTGQTINVYYNRLVSWAQGSYTYTGQIIGLIVEALLSMGKVRFFASKIGDNTFYSSKTGKSRFYSSKEGDVDGHG